MKSLQKEQKAQIMEYKPQSAGINLQSPQSDSTPWTLTLAATHVFILGVTQRGVYRVTVYTTGI